MTLMRMEMEQWNQMVLTNCNGLAKNILSRLRKHLKRMRVQ